MLSMIATWWTPLASPLIIAATAAMVFHRHQKKRRAGPVTPIEAEADAYGRISVAVKALHMRRTGSIGAFSHNSFNPRFVISPEGIHHRVFCKSTLRFADIDHVEVRKYFGSVYLLFLNSSEPRLLSVNVANVATAKLVLDALPDNLALTPEAASIRDATPAAGRTDLQLYAGRFVH